MQWQQLVILAASIISALDRFVPIFPYDLKVDSFSLCRNIMLQAV